MADRLGSVEAASRNNAAWCAAVCRSHGVPGRFEPGAWVAEGAPPPWYPDAVTLGPGPVPADVVTRIGARPGATLKDSDASSDLAPLGWRVLFEASWIGLDPAEASNGAPVLAFDVARLRPTDDVRAWADAWRQGDPSAPVDLFRPALLDEPGTTFLAARDAEGAIVAGAVAYEAAGVLGLSNVFGAAWPGLVAWGRETAPAVPLVGYESGADLAAAVAAGFAVLGPLRVWCHDQELEAAPGSTFAAEAGGGVDASTASALRTPSARPRGTRGEFSDFDGAARSPEPHSKDDAAGPDYRGGMAEDDAGRSEWLVAPPEAGEVRLVVELGEGAELSPAANEALEQLVSSIEEAEVSGHMMTPNFNVGLFGSIRLNSQCNKLICNKHDCNGTFVCDTYKSEAFM